MQRQPHGTKRALVLLCLLTSAICAVHAAPQQWVKYVAPDRSFSFHYPQGWNVNQTGSIVEVARAATGEQIVLFQWKTPADGRARTLANEILALLRQQSPDLQVSGWQGEGSAVVCDISYMEGGNPHAGLMLATSGGRQGLVWVFSAPRDGFSRAQAADTLQAVTASLTSGTGSRPPTDKPASAPPSSSGSGGGDRERIEADLRAYVFVLEFGLGGPFTLEQEDVILDEMRRGTMVATADGRAKLDQYPALVKTIMALDQGRLDEMRRTLESTIRKTLDETGGSDAAMSVLKHHLDARGRPLVKSEPPLTEMAAEAYAELYAFAEASARNSDARVADLDPAEIRTIRRQLVQAWPGFSLPERTQIAGVPGLWMVLRKVIEFGGAAERRKTLGQLAALVTAPGTAGAKGAGGTATNPAVMSMASHNALMAMQTQTFNTYMWSHGFNYTPTGKMW